MKTSIRRLMIAAATLLMLSDLQAQTITVGNADAVAGGSAVVQLNWDNNGNSYRSLQFDVTFDQAVFDSVDTSVCPIEPYITGYLVTTCEQRAAPNDNQVRFGLLLIAGSIPSGNLGQLTFSVAGNATPGTTDLTVSGVTIEGDPTPTINNGQVTILGPEYDSSPAVGTTIQQAVVQGDTDPTNDINIFNDNGAPGSTLEGSCSFGVGTDAVFSFPGSTSFSVVQGDPADVVTVMCDSAGSVTTHTGTVECTHNGTNIASPAIYDLSCVISAAPEPAYGSTPGPGSVINMSAANVGDPIPDETVVIDNVGSVGTTLTGTCGLSGDSQISLTGGAYSVPQGGASSVQTLSCDSSAEGNYSATLSCSHNASNTADPATYTVNCDVGPLRPAVPDSVPEPGPIDITNGVPVPVGATAPTAPLEISNIAVPPAQDLSNLTCNLTGDAAISVAPDLGSGTSVPAGGSTSVTFSCATDAVGHFTATYACEAVTDSSGQTPVTDNAQWDVSCDVRDAKSVVEPAPASGTTLTELADPGGSAQYNVTFNETADEGIDGSVESCSLEDGTNFSILTSLPATVPAGGSLTVTVEGTDPQDGSTSVTDALLCNYTDTDNPEVGVDVRYPLVLEIGGNATFRVTKTFTDGRDAAVDVTLTCNTGLPLSQTFSVSPGNPVNFVVHDFESGTMDCSLTEGTSSGYDTTYTAGGDSQSVDDDPNAPGCHFAAVSGGDANTCDIVNEPQPVDVVIHKEWIFDGSVGEEVIPTTDLTLYCDSEIVDGTPIYAATKDEAIIPTGWYKAFSAEGNATFTAEVIPDYPSTSCHVEEGALASAVEVDNGCDDIEVSVGNGDECAITNSVFFEGIPTLSQWGLVILVVLTLGVGLIGFRRFT